MWWPHHFLQVLWRSCGAQVKMSWRSCAIFRTVLKQFTERFGEYTYMERLENLWMFIENIEHCYSTCLNYEKAWYPLFKDLESLFSGYVHKQRLLGFLLLNCLLVFHWCIDFSNRMLLVFVNRTLIHRMLNHVIQLPLPWHETVICWWGRH